MRIRVKTTSCGVCLVVSTLLIYNLVQIDNSEEREEKEQEYAFQLRNTTTKYGSCQLPVLDPWHPSGKPYLTPELNPLKNCKPVFVLRSSLDNGILKINSSSKFGETCWYRCVNFETDRDYSTSDWVKYDDSSPVRTTCEVVEVECSQRFKPTYMYLHVQIVEKPPPSTPPPPNASNVYIILIDSVSTSHLKRALPKTKQYLEDKFQATIFEYLNKVGLNSRPVSLAFLLNESPEDMPKNPWGEERKIGRWNEICYMKLNNFSNFIGYEFGRKGYRTMAMDDSGLGNFNSPDCYGFTKAPMDHYIKQFAIRLEGLYGIPAPVLYDNLHYYQCKDSYEPVFEAFQKFTRKYRNQPKFSYIWFTHIAHNNLNNLYRTDERMLGHFKELEKELDDSFVIFLADHGARNHAFRQSFIGEFEDRNPFLMISIPRKLRENSDLKKQIELNSQELVTHYDIYATLAELANENHKWTKSTSFSASSYSHPSIDLKGSSLFHPLKSPRDCNSLLIPFQYCLCQHKQVKLENPSLSKTVGKMIVEEMNRALRASDFSDKCEELSLDEEYKFKLLQYIGGGGEVACHLKIRVKPSGGLYETHFTEKSGHITLITTKFMRIDMYREQAYCLPNHLLQNYCYCSVQKAWWRFW
ncbi:unnamed protein product [Bursaphelenchus xylophilus]|uniref:(pine wood nematode) hypothetical protein n=1 Tax=Bursaphelenchus xylophilus TaxID=6326 RepID=A0A1I7S5N6_BURXY|nr:unnamed protein product [Bursaphelenchus xylophilus]CAG9124904.1 unnamed protein product [Bursaphelenchus xylophilus]